MMFNTHQGLQLWEFEAVFVSNEVMHNGNLIIDVHRQTIALNQEPACEEDLEHFDSKL